MIKYHNISNSVPKTGFAKIPQFRQLFRIVAAVILFFRIVTAVNLLFRIVTAVTIRNVTILVNGTIQL